jgi:YVTN family beta-propeller protein
MRFATVIALVAAAGVAQAEAGDERRFVKDGVAIEFSLVPVARDRGVETPLREGEFAQARFRMSDAASGRPLPGLSPSAWMDMAGVVGGKMGEQKECKDKIPLYLEGSVGIRPLVDLNSYFLLVLNKDASISVIDPVVSMTGSTSLFASVILKRPGGDWARTRDARRLYVSMPKADEVAVIDAESFKLQASIPAGSTPLRLALQRDGRYLWIGNDSSEADQSGVSVIDTETLKPLGRVTTGRGHHEIALSADDATVYVTNRDSGTVSIIDAATLKKVKDLRTGPLPIAIATSSSSQSVYVADGKSGVVTVISPTRQEIAARIATKPGLGPVRFSDDGRWGFAVNPAERAVFVIDAAENRVAHEIALDGRPYQIAFTRAFAYVRLLDSPQVKMVNLASLGAGKTPIVQGFGAGTVAPMTAGDLAIADSVSPAATEAAVFAVNPADSTTYFYMEGMNAPMGSFSGYGHEARAVSVVDRSLKEVEPGVYAATVRIPASGRYDVALLLDSPRVLHCFSAEAQPDPALVDARQAVTVDFLDLPPTLSSGGAVDVRLSIQDAARRIPRTGLADVRLLYHAVPGGPRQEALAEERPDGTYGATLELRRRGTWYVFVSIPSIGVTPSDVLYRGVVVRDAVAGNGAGQAR